MLTFVDYPDLRRHISTFLQAGELYICSVDGHRQSGKTTLAKQLAKDLTVPRISTDDYRKLDLVGRPYIEQLSLEALATDISKMVDGGLVLVEGICVGWTFQRMAITPDMRVYCKRMTQAGLWADDLENYLLNGAPEPSLSQFDREVVAYHLQTMPDLNADVIYFRDGDALAGD